MPEWEILSEFTGVAGFCWGWRWRFLNGRKIAARAGSARAATGGALIDSGLSLTAGDYRLRDRQTPSMKNPISIDEKNGHRLTAGAVGVGLS
jgi:hypothetical protein